MKTLLIGADGLLGSYWFKTLKTKMPEGKVVGTSRRSTSTSDLVFLDLLESTESRLNTIFKDHQPTIVIYLAGVTNVDECELNQKIASRLNTDAPTLIAKICRKENAQFVFLSSDHLFGGEVGRLFTEETSTSPSNFYAKTKAMAEKMILNENKKALVIRTNFYGKSISKKPSFTDWIYKNLTENCKINIASDIYFNPVFMGDLVQVVHLLVEKKCFGIYNIASDERISKSDFVLKFARYFDLKVELISTYEEASSPRPVKRPLEMSLSNQKVKSITGYNFGDTLAGFQKLKDEMEGCVI